MKQVTDPQTKVTFLVTDDEQHAIDTDSSSFAWTCLLCRTNHPPSTAVRVFETHQDGWRRVGLVCCHHSHSNLETFLSQRQVNHA